MPPLARLRREFAAWGAGLLALASLGLLLREAPAVLAGEEPTVAGVHVSLHRLEAKRRFDEQRLRFIRFLSARLHRPREQCVGVVRMGTQRHQQPDGH